MFVGCSERGVSVITKDVENIGIIRAFCLRGGFVKFFSARGQKKWLDCGLLGGSLPRLTLWFSVWLRTD